MNKSTKKNVEKAKKKHQKKAKKSPANQYIEALSDTGNDFSALADLASHLRFSLNDGHIWLDTERVTLIHFATLTSLSLELMTTLGMTEARSFLTRMGYTSGTRDANLARKLRPDHSVNDAFMVGPQLRVLQGVVALKPVQIDIDIDSGQFYFEFTWNESFEVDAHLSAFGHSDSPMCWMQVGYISGYASSFTGHTIMFKEVECSGRGNQQCRIIGKPLKEWDDIEDELRALQPEDFINKFSSHRAVRAVSAKSGKVNRSSTQWGDMIGVSSGFISACRMLKKVGRTTATVLFHGETGVGKEQFAHTLHDISPRSKKPFVAVNCAAIPENLLESELFGVEKGAFTGAVSSRPGRFERADGGTLFLDEVGTLSMPAQIKLLRVLQEQEIERVGDTKTRKIDVRLVTATNIDLWEAVKGGNFREDLLFRINIFPIRIPPLRERRDDIPLLMDHFLQIYCRMHQYPVVGFTEKAVDALYEYDYPGNIRELENLIERAVIMSEPGRPIERSNLFINEDTSRFIMKLDSSGSLQSMEDASEVAGSNGLLDQFLSSGMSLAHTEQTLLNEAVQKANGNLAAAARMLGLSRPQLAYRLKKSQHAE